MQEKREDPCLKSQIYLLRLNREIDAMFPIPVQLRPVELGHPKHCYDFCLCSVVPSALRSRVPQDTNVCLHCVDPQEPYRPFLRLSAAAKTSPESDGLAVLGMLAVTL